MSKIRTICKLDKFGFQTLTVVCTNSMMKLTKLQVQQFALNWFFHRMLWFSVISPWLFAPAPEEKIDEKKQKKLDRKMRRAN